MAGSAAVSRVAAIGSGSASGGRRSKLPSNRPPRRSARVSAQPTIRKNLLVPGQAATSCSFPRGARPHQRFCSLLVPQGFTASDPARDGGGDGGGNVGRQVAAGFRRGARKYVAAYCRSLPCGPIVVPALRAKRAAILIKRNDLRSAGNRERAMKDWTEGEIRWITLEAIGERYRRYRLPDAAAEAAMAGSLSRYGQLSPLAVCLREERPEVLDGFKRLAASQDASCRDVASGAACRGGRTDGQGDHSGTERHRRSDEGVGGGMDRPSLGA